MMTQPDTVISAKPGSLEIKLVREFNAPGEKVFRAFTEKKLLEQWWGPPHTKSDFQKFDPRKGGEYRYIHSKQTGEYLCTFSGVFHEVTAPERIIQTNEFEDLPEKGHVILETIVFTALPGNRTLVEYQDVFQSVADRDAAVASGMSEGVAAMHNRLDQLLPTF